MLVIVCLVFAYVIGIIVGSRLKFYDGVFIITDFEDEDGPLCMIKMYDENTERILHKKHIVLEVKQK